MGYSLSWLAVKGKSPQVVRDELGFHPTGAREEIPESDLSAAEMPNGWYLIVANHSGEQVASDAMMQKLSSSGGELVTCFVEEHVMASKATGWKDGQMKWSVTHDCQKSRQHLDVQGEPPAEFAAIRDRLLAKDKPGQVDYIFNIPVEIAQSVAGYRHDRDVPGLTGDVFEVLAGTVERTSAEPKKSSFFKRLFGG
jgi:hypothetical protein